MIIINTIHIHKLPILITLSATIGLSYKEKKEKCDFIIPEHFPRSPKIHVAEQAITPRISSTAGSLCRRRIFL